MLDENKFIEAVDRYYSKDCTKYHTIYHIKEMFKIYNFFKEEFFAEFPSLVIESNLEKLFEAIAWHDCIYIPGCPMNESFSAQMYNYFSVGSYEIVRNAILSTQIGNDKFNNDIEKVLHDLDWFGFSNWELMNENEEKIIHEAIVDQRYTYDEVRKNQLKFYKSLLDKKIYVTKTFAFYNITAQKNIKNRIEQMEKEKRNEQTAY